MSPPSTTLTTPDGRYIVVRGRLWRATNPNLAEADRVTSVAKLMQARRDVARALRSKEDQALRVARDQVDAAKRSLGERGPVWWSDDAPDLNRRLIVNTVYSTWYERIASAEGKRTST